MNLLPTTAKGSQFTTHHTDTAGLKRPITWIISLIATVTEDAEVNDRSLTLIGHPHILFCSLQRETY
jgi:hypothetical protein